MIIPGQKNMDAIRRNITSLELELMNSDPNEPPNPFKCGQKLLALEANLTELKMALETECGVICHA
jgi:hypothetical protein